MLKNGKHDLEEVSFHSRQKKETSAKQGIKDAFRVKKKVLMHLLFLSFKNKGITFQWSFYSATRLFVFEPLRVQCFLKM